MPVTATAETSAAWTPASLRARVPGVGPQLEVAGLAEPLLPQLGPLLARRPPAVGELVGGRGAPQVLGEQRRARPGVPHHHGGRRVPAGRLVAAGGQAVAAVGRHHQHRPGAGQRGDEGAHPRAQRPAEVEGRHVGERAAGPGGRRWHWSCRGRPGWRWRTTGPPGAGAGPARRARRAASTPMVVVSSSWEATALAPRPPPEPRKAAISVAGQPPVGDVAGGRGDSTHGRERSRRPGRI